MCIPVSMADEQRILSRVENGRAEAAARRNACVPVARSNFVTVRDRFEKLLNARPPRAERVGLYSCVSRETRLAGGKLLGRVIVPFVKHGGTPSSICITIVSRDVSHGGVGSVREYTTTAGSQPFLHRWEPLK